MPKPCSVCGHEARDQIDRALLAGVPYRTLAAKYNLSPSALCRHTRHLARALEVARTRQDQKFNREILDKLDLLETRLNRMFKAAAETSSYRVALDCIREYTRVLTLQEKFRVRLTD
ncbi:MAG: hypothetical protein WAU47_09425 [Desulfobaccales bacterium]